ncbi:MAG: CHAT domain-containing protein [Candidatus Zhuqueibacterota bacterium]
MRNPQNPVQELEKRVLEFERTFYASCLLDSAQLHYGKTLFDSLIHRYLTVHSQVPKRSFDRIAFTYLEKWKSLRTFHQFSTATFSDSERIGFSKIFIDNYDRLQKHYKQHFPKDAANEGNSTQLENYEPDFPNDVSAFNQNLLLFLTLQQPITVSFLQQSFLNEHEALLDYWIYNDEFYVFIVTADSFLSMHWEVPVQEVGADAGQLIAALTKSKNLLELEFDYALAHRLYHALFEPIQPYIQQYEVILLIPDGFLTGFPFETLITDTTITRKIDRNIYYHCYSKFHYLLNRYAFCYNSSAAEMLPVPSHQFSPSKKSRRLLTMSEPVLWDSIPEAMSLDFKEKLAQSTDHTSEEIKRLSRLLWHHDNLKMEQTTRDEFLKIGNDYLWLYIALPGLLDNQAPMNSGILFSRHSVHDSNWCSAREMTGSFLTSDMLTLSHSAVFPTYGIENPGLLTLPQSFLFAGVKSVAFSLWEVNSFSTSQFMSKFYWELKYKRQTNVRALREAKIASMKDVFEFSDKHISRAHPYFWAGFELIGNPKIRPPSTTKVPYWAVIIAVYVIVIVSALIITRRTVPARNES